MGTADDILIATGENLAQVPNRILGTAAAAPLFSYIPGFVIASVRGGIHMTETQDLTFDIENLADRNYRGISWGMDAPGRSLAIRYTRRF